MLLDTENIDTTILYQLAKWSEKLYKHFPCSVACQPNIQKHHLSPVYNNNYKAFCPRWD